jgi:hypothetical protein
MTSYINYLFFALTSLTLNLMTLTPTTSTQYHEKQVQVRGFWYPLNEQEGILASYPDLKSCCVGSAHSVNEQVFVKNFFESITTKQLVTLEGIFKINPKYNQKGELIQLYVLEQTHLVQTSYSYLLLFIFISIIGFFIYYKFIFL